MNGVFIPIMDEPITCAPCPIRGTVCKLKVMFPPHQRHTECPIKAVENCITNVTLPVRIATTTGQKIQSISVPVWNPEGGI